MERPSLPDRPTGRPRVLVSACLLGRTVRYDGGHKLRVGLVAALEGAVEIVETCPEFEAGLGVPRPPMRVERKGAELRLVRPGTGEDVTERMEVFVRERVRTLRRARIDGVVLKSRSPSCALLTAPVIDAKGAVVGRTDGWFARALRAALGPVPCADEEELLEPRALERFLAAVRRRHALRRAFESATAGAPESG